MIRIIAVVAFISSSQVGCARPEPELPERAHQPPPQVRAEQLIEMAKKNAAFGDYNRAEQYLNLALEQGAPEGELVVLLVDACVRAKRYRDAVQYLENYLRTHPADQRSRFLLGSLYWAIGDTQAAQRELSRVVSRAPEHASARYALAVLSRDELSDA